MKKWSFVGIGAFLVAIAAFLIYVRLDNAGLNVKTVTVEYGPVSAYVSAAGSVINREELAVNSPIATQLVTVLGKEGGSVRQGQVLATFDGRESNLLIEKANAALKVAVQNEAAAKLDWGSLHQIFLIGGEARKTVDDAKLRWQALQKEVQVAQQELLQARLQHEKLRITAPTDSLIVARFARPGTWVRVGDPLFKLAPEGVREIEVKLDAGDSAALVVGKDVSVTTDTFPGREWKEKITWVSPATNKDGVANTLSVRVSLGSDAPPLVLGQQVDVKIISASVDKALKIPSGAIVSREGKPLVAVVEDGRVRFLPIKIGIESVATTEVKSGLNPGQKIILTEGRALREGEKIKFAVDVSR